MDLNRFDILLVGYEDDENLGLRSIAAFLAERGIRVGIAPYKSSTKREVLDRILTEHPKIVGFSLIFQRMLPDFAELIGYLRANGIKAHFTIGGHFPTIEFSETLKLMPGLDTVIRHEGEETLLDLYQNLGSPELWHKINGLVYRKDRSIEITPPRPLIQNLDSLPFIVRSDKIRAYRGLGVSSMLASRGCYYDCSFCSIRQFYADAPGPRRRSRSPSNVAEEMERLFKRGVRIYSFKDDDFSMKGSERQEWIDGLLGELKRRKLSDNILWRASCRVDEFDVNTGKRLKDAGLEYLFLGIESGCEQGLKTFNKHYSTDDIIQTRNALQEAEMSFDYGFMLLDPYTSFESVRENVAFLRELCEGGQVHVHFTKMLPYAGTPIAIRLKEEGRLIGSIDSPDYDHLDPRVNLLEIFLARAFYDALFRPRGTVGLLQYAKFDSIVLKKFFQDEFDVDAYAESVRILTEKFNESAIETIVQATHFMEARSYGDIIIDWEELELLANKELSNQSMITCELNKLIPMEE